MTLPNECTSGDQHQLDQVIAEYLRAEAVGQAGSVEEWLDRYPTFAAGLAEFFDNRQAIGNFVVPIRSEQPTVPVDYAANHADGTPRLSAEFDTVEFTPQPPHLSNSRYRSLRFHARGGMGEIWLAEDELVGRQVAVKKLRSGRDMQRARFLVEAQITGQLEHPSVVPLHDLGLDEAGHPFYVMKFIQGRRLGEVVAEYHAKKSSLDWPSDLEFRRLLEKFANVCNVVAYAHSKGVLHRDIKPDNVMFGPYGEVIVLDWGLAKLIGQPDEAGGRTVRLSGEGSTATQDGSIVGSPYYMSPEGAAGQPESVDQTSDVYLLGATLYQILTNEPPRKGTSNWELIDLALNSRPADPRKIDARIPRAIEAICLKAMAFSKLDRYASPLALAEDVQKFLAGKPNSAYKEPLAIRVGRWLRRHRRGILGIAVAAGVALLAAFAIHARQEAQNLSRAEEARQQLVEFNRLADQAQYFAANTDAVSERTPYYNPQRALTAGNAALAIAAPWGEQAQYLPIAGARAQVLSVESSLLMLLAQSELHANGSNGTPHNALTLLDRAAHLQPASRGYHQLRGRCLTLLGNPDAARHEQLEANATSTVVTAQDHFLQGEFLRTGDVGSGASAIAGDEQLPTRENLKQAVAEFQQALKLDPQHYWARYQLGRCFLALGRAPESIETLGACIAMRPTSPWAYTSRGLARAVAGNPNDAIDDLDRAIELDPQFYPARLNRGYVYWLQKNSPAAKSDFDAVLSAPADHVLIEAAYYRGQLLLQEHRDRQALADFSAVIDALPYFMPAYWFRAQAQFRLGNNTPALDDIHKCLTLQNLASKSENTPEGRVALGLALRKMGQQLDGDLRTLLLKQSVEQLESGIALGKPTADALENLGAVRELLEQPQPAIDAYTQGLVISHGNLRLHNLRGWSYIGAKQYDLARADFVEALRLAPDSSESHSGLGYALAQLGHTDEARLEASAAVLAGPNNYLALHNAACVYSQLSMLEPDRAVENENLALAALTRATSISRQGQAQPDADEISLIQKELPAFTASLKLRPEFQKLLRENSLDQKN